MWLFFIVCALASAAVIVGVTNAVVSKRKSPRERALESALRQIRDEANVFRETDSGLAFTVLDVIRDMERKELL